MRKQIFVLYNIIIITLPYVVWAGPNSVKLTNASSIDYYSNIYDYTEKKEKNYIGLNNSIKFIFPIEKSENTASGNPFCLGVKSDQSYNQLICNKISAICLFGLSNNDSLYFFGGFGIEVLKDNILNVKNKYKEDVLVDMNYSDCIVFYLEIKGLFSSNNEARSLNYGEYSVVSWLKMSYPEIIPIFIKFDVKCYSANKKSNFDPLVDEQGVYVFVKTKIGYSFQYFDVSVGPSFLKENYDWQKYKTDGDFSSKESSGSYLKLSSVGMGFECCTTHLFESIELRGDIDVMKKRSSSSLVICSSFGVKYKIY
jgi:hypothetical protein